MNPKERLIRTLDGQSVDRAPFICPGGMMTMAVSEAMDILECGWPEAHVDAGAMARLTLGMAELSGLENLGVPYCMTVEAEGMGADIALGGRQREPHVMSYPMAGLDDFNVLRPFDPAQGRALVCAEAIEQLKKTTSSLPIIANLSGPVSLATSIADPMLYYRAFHRNKEAVHRLNDFCTEVALRLGDAWVDAGADLICIADPSATGDLIGPRGFEEFVIPYLDRLSEHFQNRRKVPVIVHICGDIGSFKELPSKLAAKAVSVDSQVSIRNLQQQAKGKVTMGNVSTFTLEKGTPDSVARAAAVAIKHGVDILAPACGIAPGTPLANLRSLSALVREQGHD